MEDNQGESKMEQELSIDERAKAQDRSISWFSIVLNWMPPIHVHFLGRRRLPTLFIVSFRLLTAAVFPLGCSDMSGQLPSVPADAAVAGTSSSKTFPPELTQQVRKAEEIGRYIFLEDVIAAKANELLLQDPTLRDDNRRQGWIVVQDSHCALVRFVGKDGDHYTSLYDICFTLDSMTGPQWESEVTKHDPPLLLPSLQQNMFRARQLAIASLPERCSDRYRLAMVPGNLNDQKLWAVYFIAASGKPDGVMVGGHTRIAVTEDGQKVLRTSKLSDCLQLPAHNGDPLTISEFMSDTPTEIHVYLNKVRQSPVYVGTRAGLWKVDEGQISLIEGRSKEQRQSNGGTFRN